MDRVSTSERLQELINEGLTQAEILRRVKPFAEKYNTTITKSALSRYVSGEMEPKHDKIIVLAKALNVTETWLSGFPAPRNPSEMIKLEKKNAEQDAQLLRNANCLDEAQRRKLSRYAEFMLGQLQGKREELVTPDELELLELYRNAKEPELFLDIARAVANKGLNKSE